MNRPDTIANLNIPDDLIDRAYDVMSIELGHWQIVGPQRGRAAGDSFEREFYTATRAPNRGDYVPSIIQPNTGAETVKYHFQHFKDKPFAIAYVQWNGLKAVLLDPEIQTGIARLASANARSAHPINTDEQSDA